MCPACKSRAGLDIVYGEVGPAWLDPSAPEVVFGGCCYDPNSSPERECGICGHQWRIKRRTARAAGAAASET